MTHQAVWSPRIFNQDGSATNLEAGSIVIRWRELSWNEYRKLSYIQNPIQAALAAYTIVKTHGPSLEDAPFGVAAWVGYKVINNCPFSGRLRDVSQSLVSARERVKNDYLLSSQALIAHAFNCPLKEIEDWPADQFFQAVAQAEFVLRTEHSPANPDLVAKQNQKRPRRKF